MSLGCRKSWLSSFWIFSAFKLSIFSHQVSKISFKLSKNSYSQIIWQTWCCFINFYRLNLSKQSIESRRR